MKTTGKLETETDKTIKNLYEQSEWLEDKNDQTKTEDHVETVTETEDDESKYLNTEEKSIKKFESIWFLNWTGAFRRCFFGKMKIAYTDFFFNWRSLYFI